MGRHVHQLRELLERGHRRPQMVGRDAREQDACEDLVRVRVRDRVRVWVG